MSAADVIAGTVLWSAEASDCLPWLATLPTDSVDLVMTSPPYEKARLYLEGGEDLSIARNTETWVSWLLEVCLELRRVCKGLCCLVVEGQTKQFRYSAGPLLLAADLHRRGFHLRKPPIYRRIGIPGSGGPDWWRNDYEFCICFARGGKLPWSDNTATGHPPVYGPGGEMSHRMSSGTRVNQWGKTGTDKINGKAARAADGTRQDAAKPSHVMQTIGKQEEGPLLIEGAEIVEPEADPWNLGNRVNGVGGRDGKDERKKGQRGDRTRRDKRVMDRGERGVAEEIQEYDPPVLANPGNIVECNVGGGQLGSDLAHENEAPFPEALVEPFVRCFCPENGIVLDPFAGSGTTLAVARKWGRRAIGCDLRQSQVEIVIRRMAETATMFDTLEANP